MTFGILLSASVILFCVLLNRLTQRFGIPMLLVFILLGMAFGTDGILKIPFENYGFAEKVCATALVFILFYGGFGTNWSQARAVALPSGLLSTLGVVFTAALTGLFCHFALGIALPESLLTGAVLSSTDAASVFSILRSKRLGLKHSTDSMLELESGSNDPCSYMLTILLLSVMTGDGRAGSAVWLVLTQLACGVLFGAATGLGAIWVLRRLRAVTAGFDMAFVTGVALLSYAAAALAGGNGYLSAYLCGILLGNARLPNQKALVHFFDGVTGLMQMLIFFLLGLLSTPSRLPSVLPPALAIFLFLTLAARPLAVFAILTPFRCSLRQQLLVSFAGLRGAASIVFAILATVSPAALANDLFHIVFYIVLLSIALQGALLPPCARRLGMTDRSINVMRTFSDYSEGADLRCIQFRIHGRHPWAGQEIRAVTLPPDTLILLLLRDGERIVPDGGTVLREGDVAVLSAYKYTGETELSLQEQHIPPGSPWVGRTIQDFSPGAGELVALVLRDGQAILPRGGTRIRENDVLAILHDAGWEA